jgi:hypothetical protein
MRDIAFVWIVGGFADANNGGNNFFYEFINVST